jgi:hypothetical protein
MFDQQGEVVEMPKYLLKLLWVDHLCVLILHLSMSALLRLPHQLHHLVVVSVAIPVMLTVIAKAACIVEQRLGYAET